MKNLIFLISVATFVLLISSCSSSKISRNKINPITGTWQLHTITTEGITGKVKMQLLREADFNCFVGSTWYFNRSGNTGHYIISKNGSECAAVRRNINWSVTKEGEVPVTLMYKRMDEQNHNMDTDGMVFNFKITELTAKSMQLRSDTVNAGKPIGFIYNFVKN